MQMARAVELMSGQALLALTKKKGDGVPIPGNILLPETKQAVIKLWSEFHTRCKIISHYEPKAE